MLSFVALGIAASIGPKVMFEKLPSLPSPGFAGMFAGVSHGELIAAGGSNFPDKKPWEGGKKLWYSDIYALKKGAASWRKIGALPSPLAHGVSVTFENKVICVGGSSDNRFTAKCFSLELTSGGVEFTNLADLPVNLANMTGCVVGSMLYVFGGQSDPAENRTLNFGYRLDLAIPDAKWTALPAWPGKGRMLASCGAIGETIYLVGGTDLSSDSRGSAVRTYLADGFAYSAGTGWAKVPAMPSPLAASPSPLIAAGESFVVLGGDDGSQVGVEPQFHRGFLRSARGYSPAQKLWSDAGFLPTRQVVAPLVSWNDRWILISGEVKPGIRTPDVWAITLKDK